MVVGVGFEPTYATRADLQSAAFNHSATPPNFLKFYFYFISKKLPVKLFNYGKFIYTSIAKYKSFISMSIKNYKKTNLL